MKLIALIGLLFALVTGYFAFSGSFRMEAKNGVGSTIGKSGEMKSPGSSSEAAERRS